LPAAMADDRICVAARIRPLSRQEEESGEPVIVKSQDAYSVFICCPGAVGPQQKTSSSPGSGLGSSLSDSREASLFTFDAVFDSPACTEGSVLQEVVYEQIGRPILENALEGINGCLFAYGQTGSGKTFSLFGSQDAPGVLPLFANDLLDAKRKAESEGEDLSIKVAFLELYNENLVDLSCETREPLRLFENSQEGVIVPDLVEKEIGSHEEFNALLDLATQNRSVGATCMNLHSSRSHALIQLRVESRNRECAKRAKVYLIDLAGSERQKRAQNEGTRLKEGIHINVSLSALGLVISRLSDIAQGRNHCSVPFRDSKLTFLLKNSLSGNARTRVLVALSPAATNYEESLSTLRFAQSVKRIRTRAVADITKVDQGLEVQTLQNEVTRLRAELNSLRTGLSGSTGCCYIGCVDVSSGTCTASNVDCVSTGDNSGCSGRSGDNDAVSATEALRKFEGPYRSPQGTRIEVGRDGTVKFVGTEHYPIRIVIDSEEELLERDKLTQGICHLESDGDADYRYILVLEDEAGLVWQHAPALLDTESIGDGLKIRWERVQTVGLCGTGGTTDQASPFAGMRPMVFPNLAPLDQRVTQDLETLNLITSESTTLARVHKAVLLAARNMAPALASEFIQALISLCADLDEANALLAQGADIGASGSRSLERPRLEATWLAIESNQEMSARELLRVKVIWQGGLLPRYSQVWSIPEFARWLETLRGPTAGTSSVSSTPRRTPSRNRERRSSAGASNAFMSPAPTRPTPGSNRTFVWDQSNPAAVRSPSPGSMPRPSPSPTPMPRGLDSARSVDGRSALQQFSNAAQQRPHSAEPGHEGRTALRDRATRRSPTPCGQNSSRHRASSASATSIRQRLSAAAGTPGPGDPCSATKAFDKNSMRLRNGRIFIESLAFWRNSNGHRPTAPTRRIQPGMCSVFVRKRPMFDSDIRRCDFDVLSVIRSEQDAEDSCVGREIVHHACMFDKSMVTPFILHSQFPFDGVFDVGATNEDVYRDVGQPLLENALRGQLATLFLFGQTGSGKTYTMRAIERMAVEEIFRSLDADTVVSLSYFELAGRKALDLLTEQKSEIRLREEEDGCFRPHDCEEIVVTNAEDMIQVMVEAAGRRATDATTVNASSSRSHSVCRISIMKQKQPAGRLLLVDCAGTERSRDSLYFMGKHVKESAEINSSLFALKDCIRFRQTAILRQQSLPQEGRPLRLPSVRGSLLTKVLAESLISASAQLAAIATVSPNATDAEHTIDTLRTVYTLSGRGESRLLEFRQLIERLE